MNRRFFELFIFVRKYFSLNSIARGLALFLGAFSILNILGNLCAPHFDATLWWIDLRFVPEIAAQIFLMFTSILLVAFALGWSFPKWGRFIMLGCIGFLGLVALANVIQFYLLLAHRNLQSSLPVPLSFLIFGSLLLIWKMLWKPATAPVKIPGVILVFVICLFIFPLAQIFCFGKTDYRRPADAIVVLGASAYANGEPSDALADRVRTGCEIYLAGSAKKIIFSGGPGDGAIHETESMRQMAVKLGVKPEDIFVDKMGLNTQATVKNTEPIFARLRAHEILIVSHFYHLPRIKMTYQRDGWEVRTVPAKEVYFLRETPYMVLREVAALWTYYLRPLTHRRA